MFSLLSAGMLKPEQFRPRFDARQPITSGQVAVGAAAWEAYCSGDPSRLNPFADAEHTRSLPFLAAAMRRLLGGRERNGG